MAPKLLATMSYALFSNAFVTIGATNIGVNIERVSKTVKTKFVQSIFSLFFRILLPNEFKSFYSLDKKDQ